MKKDIEQPVIFDGDNNFNLIRLLAASQVAILHCLTHFGVPIPSFLFFLDFIPGVPIFFTVSGFLIANAYSKKPNIFKYARNRMLRIFPALWVCLLITILLLIISGIINFGSSIMNPKFWQWLIAQITFFQFYTPDFLRNWGVGTPNGSLWTIPVELQFYIILPVFIWLFTIINGRLKNVIACVIFIFAVILNLFGTSTPQSNIDKIYNVSLAPFLQYFLFGFFGFTYWSVIKKFIVGKALYWMVIYILFILIFHTNTKLYEVSYYPNFIGLVSFFILAVLTLSFAFTKNFLAKKLLGGVDISYGIYIYHMVIVNFVLHSEIFFGREIIVFTLTALFAYLSWIWVESPMLRLKKANI